MYDFTSFALQAAQQAQKAAQDAFKAQQQPSLFNTSGFSGGQVTGYPAYNSATKTLTAPSNAISALQANPTQGYNAAASGAAATANKSMYGSGANGNVAAVAPVITSTPSQNNPGTASAPAAGAVAPTAFESHRMKMDGYLLDAISGMKNRQNPFTPGSREYEEMRGKMRGQAVSTYNRGQAMAAGQLNGLASGLVGAASDARSNDMRFNLRNVDADLMRQGVNWESDRSSSLLNALSGASNTAYSRERDVVGDQRLNDSQRDAFVAALTKGAVENAPAILEVLKKLGVI